MVLHVVQAHEKAIEILELWGYPSQMGMVQAYSGIYEVAKKYIDNGFLISIGSAITYEKNKETINSKISEIEGNISNIGNIVRKSSESIERIDKNIKTLKANQEELIQSTDMTSLEQKIRYW